VNGSKSWLRGRHRRGQLRDIRADVLREVLKVAALSAALIVGRPGVALPDRAATRDRAASRLTGDCTVRILLLAQPFPQRHDLGSVL
jgi:hypothetical protein